MFYFTLRKHAQNRNTQFSGHDTTFKGPLVVKVGKRLLKRGLNFESFSNFISHGLMFF